MVIKMAETEKKLTPKQRAFVLEYLVDLNATQAAIRAGYSKKSAARIGVELLNKTQVSQAVAKAQERRAKKLEVNQETVIKELARIAFADPRSVFSWGPDGVMLRDSAELTDDEAVAVADVSETRTESGGSIKAKLHDKVKALELLGRHLGMFTDKLEHSGSVDIAAVLAEGIRRAKQRG